MSVRAAWIPLFFSCFVACGGAPSPGPTIAKDGFTIDAELWRRDEEVIANRASFELECPKDKVAMHVLAAARYARSLSDVVMRAAQVGVEACGKRAVYVYLSQQGQWLMNTARE